MGTFHVARGGVETLLIHFEWRSRSSVAIISALFSGAKCSVQQCCHYWCAVYTYSAWFSCVKCWVRTAVLPFLVLSIVVLSAWYSSVAIISVQFNCV